MYLGVILIIEDNRIMMVDAKSKGGVIIKCFVINYFELRIKISTCLIIIKLVNLNVCVMLPKPLMLVRQCVYLNTYIIASH